MATDKKHEYKKGIWVKNWKYRSDKIPFRDKGSSTAILHAKNKIVNIALKRLRNKEEWEKIGQPYNPLLIIPSWTVTGTARLFVFHLALQLVDPNGPPGNTVVAPPPPRQPPPPIV